MGTQKRTRDAAADFFYKHAGYASGHRWEGARELAAAERHAAEMGWAFTWETDDDDCGDGEDTPVERYGCVCRNARGEVLASLWSIGDPSRSYARVIQAELAHEAMTEISDATMEAI